MYEGEQKTISFKEALEKFDKLDTPDLTLDELLILVIGLIDKPINGWVVLQKEVFIIYKYLENKLKISPPGFIKYKMGPFSPYISQLAELLEDSKYIKIMNKRYKNHARFMLDEKGKKKYQEIIKEIEEKLGRNTIDELIKMRKGLDQLGRDHIIDYVYRNFPEYKEKSELKEKYPELKWTVLEKKRDVKESKDIIEWIKAEEWGTIEG